MSAIDPREVPFLSKCFIIMDRTVHSESAQEEEIPLFFYPSNIPISRQVHAIQIALQISGEWAANFSKSSVSVVELKQVKLAFKEVAEYTMVRLLPSTSNRFLFAAAMTFLQVLSGDVRDSNYALVHHMDLIWDCLQFYCGSFQRLAEKGAGGRKALQKVFSR
jgi:hypothetical protein